MAGEYRRGAVEAGDVARARRHQPGFRAVGAAQPEIDHELAGSCEHATRRLRRHQRLEIQNVDQARFDELRLRKRRRDPHDRFIAEERDALGHRMDIA